MGRRPYWLLAAVSAAGLAVAAIAAAGPPGQDTVTQSATCLDGGGVLWKTRAVWGESYRDADGVLRVSIDRAGWTTTKPGSVPTDSSIRSYDGAGVRVQELNWTGRFDYGSGSAYKYRNPLNPPSAPGRAKVTVRLGLDGDGLGGCTVTFTQPGLAPTTAPTSPASPSAAADQPGDPASWRSVKAVHSDGTPGAKCRGHGDDRAAIQKHLDEISAAGGGTVYHPKGTCTIGNTLVIPGNVTYRGDGRDASPLKAAKSFPGGKALVRLTGAAKIADLWLDGGEEPNTTTVFIDRTANGAQLLHSIVVGYTRYGVQIAPGARNFLYDGYENYGERPTHRDDYAGIRCDRAQATIRMVTVNGASGNRAGSALRSTGCQLSVHGIHFERWAAGVTVDNKTTGEVISAYGGPATNPVPIIADASSGAHMVWADLVPFYNTKPITLKLRSTSVRGRLLYRRT